MYTYDQQRTWSTSISWWNPDRFFVSNSIKKNWGLEIKEKGFFLLVGGVLEGSPFVGKYIYKEKKKKLNLGGWFVVNWESKKKKYIIIYRWMSKVGILWGVLSCFAFPWTFLAGQFHSLLDSLLGFNCFGWTFNLISLRN